MVTGAATLAGSTDRSPIRSPLQEEVPRDPAKGRSEVKCQSHREQARAWATTSLLAGGSTRTSKSPEEPLTGEGTSRTGVPGQSPCGQSASAEGGQEISLKQERSEPASPTKPAREEQPRVGVPWLLRTIKQEQPGPVSYTGPTGLERPRVE